HGVRFVAAEPGAVDGLDGAVVFPPAELATGLPLPCLVFSGRHQRAADRATVVFTADDVLDCRLRGQRMVERQAPILAGRGVVGGEQVLASCAGSPAWVRRGPAQLVAGAPDELEPGEALRSRVRAGRFLEVLPLVHFLRHLASVRPWAR